MRAGRLLTLLMILSEQGRTTTAALAARLEVSRRTVLRDVSALGGAGVPVVTTAGPGGGVELLPGWRAELGALTAEQADGLWLAGHPLLARAVGLAAAGESGRAALLGGLPGGVGDGAQALERWLLVDPEPIPGFEVDPALLRDAARACRDRLEVRVITAEEERTIRPDRLVLRCGRWWLEETGRGPVPLDTVQGHRLRPRRADRHLVQRYHKDG